METTHFLMMSEIDTLKTYDRVKIISSNQTGKIISIDSGLYLIQIEPSGKFITTKRFNLKKIRKRFLN